MVTLICVLLALLPPLHVIARQERERPLERPYVYSLISLSACAAAAIQELFTVQSRTAAGDYGGIEDTISAVITICIILAAVTALLNLIALALSYEKE